jgi:hypothetical protein
MGTDRLDVKRDRLRALVLGEGLEKILDAEIGLVPDAGKERKPEPALPPYSTRS